MTTEGFFGWWKLYKPKRQNWRSAFADSYSLGHEPKTFGHYSHWAPLYLFGQVRLKETWIKFVNLIRIVMILDSPSKTDPETRACVQGVHLGNDPGK